MSVAEPTTAARFGRYLLIEHIGSGGMAAVYRATADDHAAAVVIKRILPHLAADQSFVKMLVAEGRLTARLRHRNIVRVIELGEANGETFLAMEHVDGVDLHSVLRTAHATGERCPPEVCFYIARELADALAYAHAVTDDVGRPGGIIHRDVSPSNIMVTLDGAVKLLDFGVAKALGSLRDEHTRTGTLKGKLGYMSPEQADGEAIDARSDMFSLGIVLHELLTMKRLFRADDDLKILRLVREAHVLAPSLLGATIDADADAVVLRMLSRRAEDRYESCAELVRELDPFAGTSDDLVRFLRRLGPVRRAPLAPPRAAAATRTFAGLPEVIPSIASDLAAETIAEPRSTSSLQPRRRGVLFVSAALGTLGLAAAFAFRSRPAPAPAVVAPAAATPIAEVVPAPVVAAPVVQVGKPEPAPRPPARKPVRRLVPTARPARHAAPPSGLYDPFKQ